jgi:hypothetical protein
MNYGRRISPRDKSNVAHAPRVFSYGNIFFKDPSSNVEYILSPEGVIRDKTGNIMVYDCDGKIHKKEVSNLSGIS